MLKKTRSASTTSTRATIRTTTSSELSFNSSCSGSRLGGAGSSVSDASTSMSTYSMEDQISSFRISLSSSACQPALHDDVDVIDELYEFFGNELDSRSMDLVVEADLQNRERVLRELFDTEGRFIAKIQAALEYYKKPMMSSFRSSSNTSGPSSSSLPRNFLSSNKSAGMVRGNDVELVFSNLEDILSISRRFFNGLKERFRIWGPTQLLSDIFRTLVLDASSYYTYYENYGIAMSVLERLARTPATKKHVEAMIDSTGSGQISLFALLSLPLQSITRYAQLMNELVRYTDPHHPDAQQLSQCAKRMARLEANMRHLLQNCQNVSRLVDMICLIRNCPVLLDEPRQFIMRGQLTSVSTGSYNHRDDRRMYFLLSDCLIFARPRDDITPSALYFKGKIDLRDAVIKELPKKKLNHPHAFEISINSSDPNYKYADDIDALLAAAGGSTIQMFYFKADSKEALNMWIGEIQQVIDQLNPQRRR
ncbi:Dbl homology domain-containing protein [Fennellomyces sp. T-0311]|nr:Dbl homology domain-containing protein [Fennellomyces sp. T-0311]